MHESSGDARTCPSAHIAVLRTEARRDLKAMLAPFAGISSAIVGVGIWRGGALWPVWSPIAATMILALAVALRGTYTRGWQVMRAHRDCASASGKTAAASTSVHPCHA